jgi:hypothetical protein
VTLARWGAWWGVQTVNRPSSSGTTRQPLGSSCPCFWRDVSNVRSSTSAALANAASASPTERVSRLATFPADRVGQELVVDRDRLGSEAGRLGGLGEDEGDRLADEADVAVEQPHVAGQGWVLGITLELPAGEVVRPHLRPPGLDVGRPDHAHDFRHLERGGRVDRPDHGVRVRAPDEGSVERVCGTQIGNVPNRAGDLRARFDPRHPLSDHRSSRHDAISAPLAAMTASTIFT